MKAQTDPARKVLGLYLDQGDGESVLLKHGRGVRRLAHGQLHAARAPGDHDRALRAVRSRALPRNAAEARHRRRRSRHLRLSQRHRRIAPFPEPGLLRRYGRRQGGAPALEDQGGNAKGRRPDSYYRNPETRRGPQTGAAVPRQHDLCLLPHRPAPAQSAGGPRGSRMGQSVQPDRQRSTGTARERSRTSRGRTTSSISSWRASSRARSTRRCVAPTRSTTRTRSMHCSRCRRGSQRAERNPPEQQSAANLLVPGILDAHRANPRHTPRVLIDGADSIGVSGPAGARLRQHRHLPRAVATRCTIRSSASSTQRPFELATIDAKSAFWRAADRPRGSRTCSPSSPTSTPTGETPTRSMKLAHAPGGQAEIARDRGCGRGRARRVHRALRDLPLEQAARRVRADVLPRLGAARGTGNGRASALRPADGLRGVGGVQAERSVPRIPEAHQRGGRHRDQGRRCLPQRELSFDRHPHPGHPGRDELGPGRRDQRDEGPGLGQLLVGHVQEPARGRGGAFLQSVLGQTH